ncbi:hypothetical protein D7I47_09790 [Protaetiibacter intestinalis]|uniref:Uncharacterized protein n=1 Tax=Protaetiibacter intestinalis TaxID=2419774 RepID=A0A387B4K7_9MICO|nr:hypothetical protein D7I47_09790 [Protaetiibacter intestinalis]
MNLTNETSMRKSIRRLTEQVTGRKEELASTRAELRDRFLKAAEVAREGGASDLYTGLSIAPGIPLPAWIAVFEMEIGSTDFAALGIEKLREVLDAAVGAAPEGGETSREDIASPTPIHAVRHTWRRSRLVSEGDVEREFDLIEADYWIAAAAPARLAMITFTTAYAEYEEEMLELFDAVVSTIRWEVAADVREEQRS